MTIAHPRRTNRSARLDAAKTGTSPRHERHCTASRHTRRHDFVLVTQDLPGRHTAVADALGRWSPPAAGGWVGCLPAPAMLAHRTMTPPSAGTLTPRRSARTSSGGARAAIGDAHNGGAEPLRSDAVWADAYRERQRPDRRCGRRSSRHRRGCPDRRPPGATGSGHAPTASPGPAHRVLPGVAVPGRRGVPAGCRSATNSSTGFSVPTSSRSRPTGRPTTSGGWRSTTRRPPRPGRGGRRRPRRRRRRVPAVRRRRGDTGAGHPHRQSPPVADAPCRSRSSGTNPAGRRRPARRSRDRTATGRVRGAARQRRHRPGRTTLIQVVRPIRCGRAASRELHARIEQRSGSSTAARPGGRRGAALPPPLRPVRPNSSPFTARRTCCGRPRCRLRRVFVAKEYIAARADNSGAVILSEFCAAAEELPGAVRRQPVRCGRLRRAVLRAVASASGESRRRMGAMRRHVHTHDIHHWAGRSPGRPRAECHRAVRRRRQFPMTVDQPAPPVGFRRKRPVPSGAQPVD